MRILILMSYDWELIQKILAQTCLIFTILDRGRLRLL